MIRSRPLLLTLAVVAGSASGSTVYKWKDASGGLHFSDTPPPANAILISGPKVPVPQAAPSSQSGCRADLSAEECAEVRAAMRRDAEGLADGTPSDDPARRESDEQKMTELRAQECEQLRQTRVLLEQRLNGKSSEILTDEERAAAPASIAEIDSRIGENCG